MAHRIGIQKIEMNESHSKLSTTIYFYLTLLSQVLLMKWEIYVGKIQGVKRKKFIWGWYSTYSSSSHKKIKCRLCTILSLILFPDSKLSNLKHFKPKFTFSFTTNECSTSWKKWNRNYSSSTDHILCSWPIFLIYIYLSIVMRNCQAKIEKKLDQMKPYQTKVDSACKKMFGHAVDNIIIYDDSFHNISIIKFIDVLADVFIIELQQLGQFDKWSPPHWSRYIYPSLWRSIALALTGETFFGPSAVPIVIAFMDMTKELKKSRVNCTRKTLMAIVIHILTDVLLFIIEVQQLGELE